MSFSFRGETRELNDLTRQEASGSFIQLSGGITHYDLSNPEAAETVVLVHGFSVPSFIYDPTFAYLTAGGFRVLRYDLFGRGYSDRPETRYGVDLFVTQLRDLLDALHLHQPLNLVGLSMGGPIITKFTVRFPERVDKLVLIGPAGAKSALPWFGRIVALPMIGESLLNLIASGGKIQDIALGIFDRSHVEHFQDRYLPQMQFKGFKRAILSTIRSGILGSFLDDYRRIGKMRKPVLLFWGRQDHTVPFRQSQDLVEAIPQAEFHAIEACGHIPHYEKPEEVNPLLLAFLRR